MARALCKYFSRKNENWQLIFNRDSFYRPHKWMHIHYHLIDEGFMHADQVFFGQAVILILYYVVFGVFISLRYGSGLTDLKFTVYGYPPIVVIAIGILFFVMELSMLKHDLNDYHTFERIIVSTVFFRV